MKQETRLADLIERLDGAKADLSAATDRAEFERVLTVLESVAEELILEAGWLLAKPKESRN